MPPVLPPPVRPGDRVGIAALSGAIDPVRLANGIDELSRLGFIPVPARNLGSRTGLFAGDEAERVAAFHALADDPGIGAIVFARGGHGLLPVLPLLDWARLAAVPRAYVGYSDLTPFLLNVVERLGWVAFHGPMVAADMARGLSAEEESSLLSAFAGDVQRAVELTVLNRGEGEARGILLGGCLSLLASVAGTPFATPLADSLLFLEDIDEPLYRIDRMLTQLDLSGSLTGIRAMILGASIASPSDADALAQIRDRAGDRTVVCGIPAGHTTPNLTLPLGCPARIDTESSHLVIEHP